MADPKVVFFTALAPEFRGMVVAEAPPGINVVSAPVGMDEVEKIGLVTKSEDRQIESLRRYDNFSRHPEG